MKNLNNNSFDFDKIRQVFEVYNIDEKLIQEIIKKLKPLRLNKGEKFCSEGSKANKLGILTNGLLAAKYFNFHKNEEVISRFFYIPKNIIVTSFESFQGNKETNENIEALEDSFLVTISREELNKLYESYPELNKVGRSLAELSYIQALQRVHQLQAMSVEQRIESLLENYDGLINRLQIQHICSYIGTNRNSYSRILKGRKKK